MGQTGQISSKFCQVVQNCLKIGHIAMKMDPISPQIWSKVGHFIALAAIKMGGFLKIHATHPRHSTKYPHQVLAPSPGGREQTRLLWGSHYLNSVKNH